MSEYPKAVKRQLRELAGLAYERAMAKELGKLAERVAAWQAGSVSVWELDEAIHKYHQGPARELYSRYRGGDEGMLVVGALHDGVLTDSEVPPAAKPYIAQLTALLHL